MVNMENMDYLENLNVMKEYGMLKGTLRGWTSDSMTPEQYLYRIRKCIEDYVCEPELVHELQHLADLINLTELLFIQLLKNNEK
jgi:hypothetical protein